MSTERLEIYVLHYLNGNCDWSKVRGAITLQSNICSYLKRRENNIPRSIAVAHHFDLNTVVA